MDNLNVDPLIKFELPETDKYGTPLKKMPDCPRCGEDELGMIYPGFAVCYNCHFQVDTRYQK